MKSHYIGRTLPVCLLVLGAASVGCGAAGSDGTASEPTAESAEAIEADAVLVDDIDGDGVSDLAIRTKALQGYSSTKLLNRGGGVFERWDSSSADEVLPELSGPAWAVVGTADTAELVESVPGFADALSSLASDALTSLGLDGGGKLTPQDSSMCKSGRLCFWKNSNYAGAYLFFNNVNSSKNIGSWFNDKMTSYWNRTNKYYVFCRHSNYDGTKMCAPKGSSSGAVPSAFNDKMTSFRLHLGSDFCQF